MVIALRLDNRILYPKLTIKSCIALEQLFGSPTRIIETMPSLQDQVFLIGLCLQQYNLTEDELYELIDSLDDPLELIMALYEQSGLISQQEDSEPTEAKETSSTDELEQEQPQTFGQMVEGMLQSILEINLMSIDKFYDSTLQEVVLQIEAHKKYKKNKSLDNALEIYQLADLTSHAVARLLSKDAKMPEFKKYFSYLLEDEMDSDSQESDGLTAEERMLSAQLTEWAYAMQKKQENNKVQDENKLQS